MRHSARQAETSRRRWLSNPVWFRLLRLSPWRASYIYLSLSINRFPLSSWASLMSDAGLAAIVPERCDHPLALIAAQRPPLVRSP
jgi:hypothetical protein